MRMTIFYSTFYVRLNHARPGPASTRLASTRLASTRLASTRLKRHSEGRKSRRRPRPPSSLSVKREQKKERNAFTRGHNTHTKRNENCRDIFCHLSLSLFPLPTRKYVGRNCLERRKERIFRTALLSSDFVCNVRCVLEKRWEILSRAVDLGSFLLLLAVLGTFLPRTPPHLSTYETYCCEFMRKFVRSF